MKQFRENVTNVRTDGRTNERTSLNYRTPSAKPGVQLMKGSKCEIKQRTKDNFYQKEPFSYKIKYKIIEYNLPNTINM